MGCERRAIAGTTSCSATALGYLPDHPVWVTCGRLHAVLYAYKLAHPREAATELTEAMSLAPDNELPEFELLYRVGIAQWELVLQPKQRRLQEQSSSVLRDRVW